MTHMANTCVVCCLLLLHYTCIDTGAQNGFAKVEEKMVTAGKTADEVETELERRSSNNSNAGTCISYASLFVFKC
jgi:hypothetical protein